MSSFTFPPPPPPPPAARPRHDPGQASDRFYQWPGRGGHRGYSEYRGRGWSSGGRGGNSQGSGREFSSSTSNRSGSSAKRSYDDVGGRWRERGTYQHNRSHSDFKNSRQPEQSSFANRRIDSQTEPRFTRHTNYLGTDDGWNRPHPHDISTGPSHLAIPHVSSGFQGSKGDYSSLQTPGHSKAKQQPQHAHSQKRPSGRVPAPVPSFGFELPKRDPEPSAPSNASAKEPAAGLEQGKKRKRDHNQLGLTPSGEDYAASDEDVDEEAKLAKLQSGGQNSAQTQTLSFIHKGKLAILKTPEDIAAWIAERRKHFPTKARAAEVAERKEKEAEEAKLLREARKEEKRKLAEGKRKEARERGAQRQAKVTRGKNDHRPDQDKPGTKRPDPAHEPDTLENEKDEAVKARDKAEKLRRKFEKAQKLAEQMEKARQERIATPTKVETLDADGASHLQHHPTHGAEDPDPSMTSKEPKIDGMIKITEESVRDIGIESSLDSGSVSSESLSEKEDSITSLLSDPENSDEATSSSGSSLSSSASEDNDASDVQSSPGSSVSEPIVTTITGPIPAVSATTEDGKEPRRASDSTRRQGKIPSGFCNEYVKGRKCKFGKRCRYRHQLPPSFPDQDQTVGLNQGKESSACATSSGPARGHDYSQSTSKRRRNNNTGGLPQPKPMMSLYQRLLLRQEEDERDQMMSQEEQTKQESAGTGSML